MLLNSGPTEFLSSFSYCSSPDTDCHVLPLFILATSSGHYSSIVRVSTTEVREERLLFEKKMVHIAYWD